eukprot:2428600-Rhodomonas_salina.1
MENGTRATVPTAGEYPGTNGTRECLCACQCVRLSVCPQQKTDYWSPLVKSEYFARMRRSIRELDSVKRIRLEGGEPHSTELFLLLNSGVLGLQLDELRLLRTTKAIENDANVFSFSLLHGPGCTKKKYRLDECVPQFFSTHVYLQSFYCSESANSNTINGVTSSTGSKFVLEPDL